MSGRTKTIINAAAERLRAIARATEEGALLGSEDALVARLGHSRSTVRQVARLLEREGLLKVRRGPNGGYFAARPDARTIRLAVSAYLETQHTRTDDVMAVASALWNVVARKATERCDDNDRALLEELKRRVSSIKEGATFAELRRLEMDSRKAVFQIADSPYIELIFDINMAFAGRTVSLPYDENTTPEAAEFVRAWRHGKILELTTVSEGDQELSTIAAQHVRNLWRKRMQEELDRQIDGANALASRPAA